MRRWLLAILFAVLTNSAALSVAEDVAPVRQVAGVPAVLRQSWKLSDFYQQHVDADGIPIVGSQRVSKQGLLEAAYLVDMLLANRPDLRRAIATAKVRVAVMAPTEFTTDIPEHADLKPREHWNLRARGLGATQHRPCVSCGEENLLSLDGDPYHGENILIHEFAHTIHEMGLRAVDPHFDAKLKQAYAAAQDKELWKGTYAATNAAEYWAEATQIWFHCNRTNDRQHNHVATREQLKGHDPACAALLASVFGDGNWRYSLPAQRPTAPHLKTLDRQTLGKFAWPEELLRWKREQSATK